MRTWKESGEVPDSDDEEFDTQSSPGSPTSAAPLPLNDADDIWSIPPSPEPHHAAPARSLLAPEAPASPAERDPIPPCSSPLSPPPEDVESLAPTPRRDTTPNPEHVRLSTASPSPALSSPPRRNAPRSRSQSPPSPSQAPLVATSATVSPSRQVAVRLERSLRPRKPIQEHPYILEDAQYHRFMKSHGFKPVRVVVEDETADGRRSGQDDESQDPEFSAEDSQQISADPLGDTQESQPVYFGDEADDRDELAPTPSPKTSSQTRATSSGRPSPADDTDNTSLIGDDDLPSVSDLLRRPQDHRSRPLKRTYSSKSSASAKRRKSGPHGDEAAQTPAFKPVEIYDLPSSPPVGPSRRSAATSVSRLVNASPRPSARAIPSATSFTPSRRPRGKEIVSLLDDGDSSDNSASTESESEAIRRNVRKIRGVLPASWLRLDKVESHSHNNQPLSRRSPPGSPKPAAKRGVALPRHAPAPSNPHSTALDFLFDDDNDSDDHNDDRISNTSRPASTLYKSLLPGRTGSQPSTPLFIDDGDISVDEGDTVDRMLPGRNRKRKTDGISTDGSSATRTGSSSRTGVQESAINPRKRQQKITATFASKSRGPGNKSTSRVSSGLHRSSSRGHGLGAGRSAARPERPPMLSVLDVVKTNAPAFLRVAARAARRAPNQGKSSPSRKQINLGNRKDNVDALSVLRDWKAGKIRPRVPAKAPQRNPASVAQAPAPPLRERSANIQSKTVRRDPTISFVAPKRVVKRSHTQPRATANGAKSVSSVPDKAPGVATSQISSKLRRHDSSSRPAQLETLETSRPGKFAFLAQKRSLDASYRRSKSAHGPTAARLEQYIDSIVPETGDDHDESALQTTPQITEVEGPKKPQPRRSRLRKQHTPRFVDVTAPQFLHATDPLPDGETALIEDSPVVRNNDKLNGLGPFGTQYTHHFEIFPLDDGVFFHETMFIARGRLEKVQEGQFLEKARRVRPRASFQLGDKTLRWGPWDDRTSSELGIVVDSIVDHITEPAVTAGSTLTTPVIIAASDFIVDFVEDAVSFSDDGSIKAFLSRSLEITRGFIKSLEERLDSGPRHNRGKAILDILPRFLTFVLRLLRLSLEVPDLVHQSFEIEEVLKRMATLSCRCLLSSGFGVVEETYADLQRLSYRERGIRADRGELMLWVVLMRVLNAANIRRGGFWDVFGSVILTPGLTACSDVQQFEEAWRALFTLLPLTEFNDVGVLAGGLRLREPSDGWALPQVLLKRVLQLYQKNPSQAPSFNDYCRALLGRCHYLVEQWGWRKCAGIAGLVFDFFGAQNLAHLRNEEVYKSPLFLEKLTDSPSLVIAPEDRCFHIFVKMVGLAIRSLRGAGLIKDVKNLVARILPNHTRQYSKEQDMHQHELAALRNHHDLLCTLFWASPADLRPGVHLIEKLVVPGTSHRAACIVNLRAWGQLARFVVFSNEGAAVFRPFLSWQNNMFRQTLEQYINAESDVQQQLQALGEGARQDIGASMVKGTILANKAGAMDVMYCSVQSSLEVLKVAPSLAAATYSLNTYQLSQVFTALDISSPGFDWNILRVAIETVERYLDRVDQALDHQYSIESDGIDEHDEAEEAILLIDHILAEGLFSTARRMLTRLEAKSSKRPGTKESLCAEQLVLLSARVVNRFLQSGVTRLQTFFSQGKYNIFRGAPQRLSHVQRKYLALFAAALVKNSMLDFKDLGLTVFEIWMLSVVSPSSATEHVPQLSEALRLHNFDWVKGVPAPTGFRLDYRTCRELFAHGISSMRTSLRTSSGSTQRPGRQREELGKTLRSVMDQMKRDLASLKPSRSEHLDFVDFVRTIVALIRSHGEDFCSVDQFFLGVSAEYSPSPEDPQLHLARIMSYGIRLGEGDVTTTPTLFYYLYNNFKTAVIRDKLEGEVSILRRCVDNPHILQFLLSRMLPALVRAAAGTTQVWPLLEVYSGALSHLLTRSCAPFLICEDYAEDVLSFLSTILTSIMTLKTQVGSNMLGAEHLNVVVQLVTLVGSLRSSLTTYFFTLEGANAVALSKIVNSFSLFCEAVVNELGRGEHAGDGRAEPYDTDALLGGIQYHDTEDLGNLAQDRNPHIESFSRYVVSDVQKNWTVTNGQIMIRAPGNSSTQPGTQAGQAARFELLDKNDLRRRLLGQCSLWCSRAVARGGRRRRRRPVRTLNLFEL
ncbi:hypothetical protein RB595_004533 [Gaeumannomyces hyphopodioides]